MQNPYKTEEKYNLKTEYSDGDVHTYTRMPKNDDWRMKGEKRTAKDRMRMMRRFDLDIKRERERKKGRWMRKTARKQDEPTGYSDSLPLDNFYWNPSASRRIPIIVSHMAACRCNGSTTASI